MSSAPKELKRYGPTEGMSFTREQANDLFQQRLKKKIIKFDSIDGGLNNLLFFIKCENDQERYVLKVGGDACEHIKTEAEVNAMIIVAKYTTIPIPRVVAYSSDKNNEFNAEWIVMTRTPGKPLRTSSDDENDMWTSLSTEKKKSVIDQLVQYVSQIHSRIPHAALIGNYGSDEQICCDSNRLGPWRNYRDYFYDQLKLKIKTLKEEDVFEPVREDILKSIEDFQKLELPNFQDLPNVFTHNDLGLQNLTVNDQAQIQGIIDWEWSGSYPICEEYFRSYKPIVYDQQLTNYLYDQLEKQNIPTPRTIHRYSLLKKLYDLLQATVPWYLTSLKNPNHPTVHQKLIENRDKVKQLVHQIEQELN